MSEAPISETSIELLRDLLYVAQVVGYDHRIAELDNARLIEWKSGEGYIISDKGLRFLEEIGA